VSKTFVRFKQRKSNKRKLAFAQRGTQMISKILARKALRQVACLIEHLWWPAVVVALAAFMHPAFAQSPREFRRTLSVTPDDPVTLDVHLSEGQLQIAYGRREEVSIAAISLSAAAKTDKALVADLAIHQDGNKLRIRNMLRAETPAQQVGIVCKIDVPYRTEVNSVVDKGKQTITGIMGPVKASTDTGDIKVAYVSKGVLVETGAGNLALEVIGEQVHAKTGNGNISCIRALQGASAETEAGDIVLMVVGPSTAIVKNGTGRIDVGGARGRFRGSTSLGDLHIKAMPHDDWWLNSVSGNIRIELPPRARFDVDAATKVGEILVDRVDIQRSNAEVHSLNQKVNGGGKRIELRTDSGKIIIR
jgi:hypothetical protein